ncbi:MAG TPA: alkaline phosphatase family protein [Chloroflexota bacterium]|nr:alkaline phosphatase family protein [Chloroflexota bacterium]
MPKQDLTPDDLEGLFRRSVLSRRQFIGGLAALGVTAPSLELMFGAGAAEAAGPQTEPPRYVVMITIDAFRADYQQLVPMPNLQALARAGTSYSRAWVGQLESETPTSHTTLSTGSMPKHDGILGFEWADPKSHKKVLDGWAPGVLAGKMQADIAASGADTLPAAFKRANSHSVSVAISSEKVYAADGLGGPAADYILYHERTGPQNQILIPAAVPGHTPPAEFFKTMGLHEHLPMKNFTDWDWLSTELAIKTFAAYKPQLLMVNLPSADVYGHPYGGPADPAIFRQIVAGVDRNIGRIVQAYKSAGLYNQTLFVVVGDHGMVPNDRMVYPEVVKEVVYKAGGEYIFHTGGTAADIYIANGWHARAVAEAQLQIPGIAAAYYKVGHPGSYEYVPAPGQRIDVNLDAAYRYFLDTFVGPDSPNVVAAFRENTIGRSETVAYGDHGGMNWGAQHVPLVMAGPGIKAGLTSNFPARLMDIAPTILRLMSIAPARMDGTVLADAVVDATAAEVVAQNTLLTPLTGYQNALITQSIDNIEEDHKKGHLPPPLARAQP